MIMASQKKENICHPLLQVRDCEHIKCRDLRSTLPPQMTEEPVKPSMIKFQRSDGLFAYTLSNLAKKISTRQQYYMLMSNRDKRTTKVTVTIRYTAEFASTLGFKPSFVMSLIAVRTINVS